MSQKVDKVCGQGRKRGRYRTGATRVEAVPAKPQDECAKNLQRQRRRSVRWQLSGTDAESDNL